MGAIDSAVDRLFIVCFLSIFLFLHVVQLTSLADAGAVDPEAVDALMLPFEMLLMLLYAWFLAGLLEPAADGTEIRQRNTLLSVIGIASFAVMGWAALRSGDYSAVDRLAVGSLIGLYAISPILPYTPEGQRLEEYLTQRFGTDEEVA